MSHKMGARKQKFVLPEGVGEVEVAVTYDEDGRPRGIFLNCQNVDKQAFCVVESHMYSKLLRNGGIDAVAKDMEESATTQKPGAESKGSGMHDAYMAIAAWMRQEFLTEEGQARIKRDIEESTCPKCGATMDLAATMYRCPNCASTVTFPMSA